MRSPPRAGEGRLFEDATGYTPQHAQAVGRKGVVASFAERSGLPRFLVSDETPLRLDEARAFFEARIIGQPDAVAAVVDLVALAKASLNDPNKPMGTLLFVGPTGVGKTATRLPGGRCASLV